MRKFTQEEKEAFVREMLKKDEHIEEEWKVEEEIQALQELGEALDSPFWVHQE